MAKVLVTTVLSSSYIVKRETHYELSGLLS